MKKILFSFIVISSFFIAGINSVKSAEMPHIIGHKDENTVFLPGPDSGDPEAAQKYVNNQLLPNLTNKFLIFMLAVSVGAIIVAGILYVFSMGDSEQTKKAKDIIAWTIVGVIIAALSYTIVSILVNTNFL